MMDTRIKNIAVLVSGSGSNMQAIIDKTLSGDILGRVCVVISSNKDAYALERAEKHGIKTFVAPLKDYENAKLRDEYIKEILDSFQVDYILLAGYLGIVTSTLVSNYKNRIINIHPALLPKYGGHKFFGLNVHKAVIDAGEKKSGATVHFVDENIDTGLIIDSQSLDVLPSDTPQTLQTRILDTIEHKLFCQVVSDLCKDKIIIDDNKVIYNKE